MTIEIYTIAQLAQECKVTTRAIRLYIEKGLLRPTKVKSKFLYNIKDKVKIEEVLRMRRFGFSLKEIRNLEEAESNDKKLSVEDVSLRLKEYERRREEIDTVLKELREILLLRARE